MEQTFFMFTIKVQDLYIIQHGPRNKGYRPSPTKRGKKTLQVAHQFFDRKKEDTDS